MINNAVAVCSISLKFGTEFDHMTPNLQQAFKGQRLRSKHDITRTKIC